MALDAQNNWNVEMSQSLKLSHRPRPRTSSSSTFSITSSDSDSPFMTSTPPSPSKVSAHPNNKPPTSPLHLPPEIISQILLYLPAGPSLQPTLYSCCLLSRTWYTASISPLYSSPHLHGGNFSSFAATICPSKNAFIRHSTLAPLVRRLDMGELVHNSSKSLTARLLGRLKGNLEIFVAPQASFAVNSFAALSKCVKLKELDLSLISASISNKQLFQTLRPLTSLETLYFPRSSRLPDPVRKGEENGPPEPYHWPPQLSALHLAGGIDDQFLERQLVHAPVSLRRLSIQHCPLTHASFLLATLQALGPRLTHLTIRHPMSQLQVGILDSLLLLCPHLLALRISADFISNEMFELIAQGHPLRILDLDCSPQASADVGVDAGSVVDAVQGGKLADLRSVRVSVRLAWSAGEGSRREVGALVRALEEGERGRALGVRAGVWVMND